MRTQQIVTTLCLVLALALAPIVRAAEETPKPTPEQRLAQIKAVADSVVTVEYTLKHDAGRPPRGVLLHDAAGNWRDYGEMFVVQERPVEIRSYLIGPDLVLCQDLPVHDRFVESLVVRFGGETIPAKRIAWAQNATAVYLKLERPFKAAKPLKFDASLAGPYTGLVAGGEHGVASISVVPFAPEPVDSPTLGQYLAMPAEALVVDATGRPVGMSMSSFAPLGEGWKGDPGKWPQIDAAGYESMMGKVRAAADSGVVRVTLNFRSPKGQGNPMARFQGGEDAGDVTEIQLVGVLMNDGRVIVPAELKPDKTARLERIRVFTADGTELDATFLASLKDYGALIVKVDAPAGSGVALANEPITRFHNSALPHANIVVHGEERVIYTGHTRIENFSRGWRNHTLPVIPDDEQDTFLFDRDGRLIAFPLTHRTKFSNENRRWEEDGPQITPTEQLTAVLGDLTTHSDSSNVPLSESEENRIAWLGLGLQPMDQELARAQQVAELTRDGETGALVAFVYPGSPAEAKGVQPGWVLLRLHVPGYPQPVEVNASGQYGGWPSRVWDQLDQIPEQAFEDAPPPWPSASDALTEALVAAGYGTTVRAEFVAEGVVVTKEFTVEQSPPYYESAPRSKHAELGVTVRNVTYELRNYFQLKGDAPGVIVSKVEPGSKASVAGIRHFELITQIGSEPVLNVADFERLTKPGGELQFTLQRMTRTRQVPVKLEANAAGEGGAEEPPAADAEEATGTAE